MKKIAFIGGYDKSDLILYIARILTVAGKKVIVADTTLMQKTRYIVPTMLPAQRYVTTFDGIDVAVGFESMQELRRHFSTENDLKYDYFLGAFDSPEDYINMEFRSLDSHYFVTNFDVFSVRRGINVLKAFKDKTTVTKVIFTTDPESEEKEYLDFMSMSYKVEWSDEIIYFPFDTADLYAIYQNQRFSKVKFNNLSTGYMDGVTWLTEKLSELPGGTIKKAIRMIEK